MKTISHLIAGKNVPGAGGTPVFNPATGGVSGEVPLAGSDEVSISATFLMN